MAKNIPSKDKIIKLLIFFILGVFFLYSWISGAVKYKKFSDVQWFFVVAFSYSSIIFFHFLYRAVLSLFYTTTAPDPDYHPAISVIIPVFNEGELIKKCIVSVIESEYPGRKEIICVNDGSTDETIKHLNELKAARPDAFKLMDFSKNRGKREAIASGITSASGEIIVLIDSDTCIDRDALLNMIAPFKDRSIGATTGAVRVLNENDNLLTKVMSVRYLISFEFFRVSHSVIRTVMVCSGVLSAYRKDILDGILPSWLNQYFLGKKCTYGDDRSLTNFIIRAGYDTIYVQNAYAYTVAPSSLLKLMKMISRWNKSYIRENIVFLGFIFKKFEKRYKNIVIFDFFLTNSVLVIQYLALLISLIYFIFHPVYILKFLLTITLIGVFYMVFYIKTRKNTDFFYGLLYSYLFILLLCWTLPYAFMTMKDDSWLTR